MSSSITICFFGDVVGRPGRDALRVVIPEIRASYPGVCVVVNGENAAGGLGIDVTCADELRAAGADILTSGDHVWKFPEFREYLQRHSGWCIRPANYPGANPGFGWTVVEHGSGRIGVINLMGRTFMQGALDCPFQRAQSLLRESVFDCDAILVDFHAEATPEKMALARVLDGKVSVVVGTHTHVQTADEQILPGGTAFISDAGMCGPAGGVIGMRSDAAIARFTEGTGAGYKLAGGDSIVSGVVVKVDPTTARATAIERIQRRVSNPPR